MVGKHVIKHKYNNGTKQYTSTSWCGAQNNKTDWIFKDAQHVALDVCGIVPPCKKCIKAIIKELEKGL